MIFFWQVDIIIWQVNINNWQVNIKIWQVDIIIWQVMAEICHHSFVINRENIKTARDLNISRLKVSDIFIDLRNLDCFVFLYYVSEFLWEQIHIKHLINYQNRIFILISHYSTIVFESNSEKQRFAFTTRRGYPGFWVRGYEIRRGVLGP